MKRLWLMDYYSKIGPAGRWIFQTVVRALDNI